MAKASAKKVETPVQAPVETVAPVKTEKKTSKKVAAAAEPVVVAPVVVAQAVEEVVSDVPEITWNEEIKTLQTTVESQISTLKGVLANLKRLEKRFGREIKDARKKRKAVRKENADGTPVNSPFKNPIAITDELGAFLKKGKSATASRSEVTVAISAYIKEKNLREKHHIKPDAALQKLLSIGANDELTYFNLQKYLNKHYIKATPTA